jgi:hypothetical protein
VLKVLERERIPIDYVGYQHGFNCRRHVCGGHVSRRD